VSGDDWKKPELQKKYGNHFQAYILKKIQAQQALSANRIKEGDKLPSFSFKTMGPDGTPKLITSQEVFAGKKVVLFAVPGAFTPGCSKTHCPGFVSEFDKIRSKGVDVIACTAVNDAFVMDAWCKAQKAEGKLLMLADGNGDFAKQIGLLVDLTAGGMGFRSKRYAMVVQDNVVTFLGVDDKGVTNSAAENVLSKL